MDKEFVHPSEDQRGISELVTSALSRDSRKSGEAIAALHWRGSREVLEHALELCESDSADIRICGANILAQTGVPERAFPEECFEALMSMLGDENQGVLAAAITGLSFVDQERAGPSVLKYAEHANPDVRSAVAFSLCGLDSSEAISVLMKMTNDCEAEIRDWATFGLARHSDVNDAAVREALAERLEDEDEEVRFEAVCGLGKRRDKRAFPYLIPLLMDEPQNSAAREASAQFLGLDSDVDIETEDLIGSLERMKRFSHRKPSC